MPEAGRRVKCSETPQHFPSHLILRLFPKESHTPPRFISVYFLLYFFLCCDPVAKVISVKDPLLCPTPCPTCQVCQSLNHGILCCSENIVLLVYSQALFTCHEWMLSSLSHSITITGSTKRHSSDPAMGPLN